MKQKKPDHCRGCLVYHNAGHAKGTALGNSKYNNWCPQFSNTAPKAVSLCLIHNGKRTEPTDIKTYEIDKKLIEIGKRPYQASGLEEELVQGKI